MYFHLLMIFICLATVLARIEDSIEKEEDDYEELRTLMESANYTLQWFNCDGDKEDGFEETMASLNKCLKRLDMDENWKDLIGKCFPGMFFPATMQDARKWHCNKPLEEIAKSIECENTAFEEMGSEEAIELIDSLQSCHWNSSDSSEIHFDEDENNEGKSYEDKSYEDSKKEYAIEEDEY